MWARSALALAIGALTPGCGGGEESSVGVGYPLPVSHAGADHEARREDLRAHLRAELGEGYDTPLPPATAAQLELGAELWSLLCAECHGMTGRGTRNLSRILPVEPGDLTDPARAGFYSDRAKLHIVANGSEGTPMIGWSEVLSEESLRATVAHIDVLIRAQSERRP